MKPLVSESNVALLQRLLLAPGAFGAISTHFLASSPYFSRKSS